MNKSNVLVTGANGFIGQRLVARLIERGESVRCLIRPGKKIAGNLGNQCDKTYGNIVESPSAIVKAIANVHTVYHLAASTHTVHSRDLIRINVAATENLLKACATRKSPPSIVLVSSIAAVGPNLNSSSHRENAPCHPVSFYGRSKLACERIAKEYSRQLPISIVRPPMVLGEGDRQGLQLFRTIDQWGWHFVPGFSTRRYSVIHVDDLANMLMAVAARGKRLTQSSATQGIYFAAAPEALSGSELGQLIGMALGREETRIWKVGRLGICSYAIFNEIRARVSGKPQYLNIDKFREIFSGSWVCSSEKMANEVGVVAVATMLQRLEQTAEWYRQHGWLDEKPARQLYRPVQKASPEPEMRQASHAGNQTAVRE